MQLKFWRIAQPLYEGALGVGAGSPAADPTPLGAPADPAGEVSEQPAADSLAAHEAAHGPESSTEPEPEPESRAADGRFKPRRRAASQQADADDVPLINEQTKRLKALEETHGKDIARKDGESERVYTLRRRADLLERLAQAPAPQSQPAPPQPARQAQPVNSQPFPEYEDLVQIQGYENTTFNQYIDARARHAYAQLREQERATEASEKAAADYQAALTTHQQNLKAEMDANADWQTVVTPDLPWTRVLDEAVVSAKNGGKALYYLGKNRDVLAALVAKSLEYSPQAVSTMRQLLDSFVAMQRPASPPSAPVAAPTRSALALAPSPAPKPPNLVRTSASTPADDPPGADDQSLYAHERHYGPRARR